MEPLDKLQQMLKRQGHSITKPRTAVSRALLDSHEALTISQLIGLIPQIDTVSVYRTVELFEKAGIVHRVWNGFKSKIELSEEFSPHHHHFTCSRCGSSLGIKDDRLEASLHALEAVYGFDLRQHSVELSGYCRKCRAELA